jgi:hypothetical protein
MRTASKLGVLGGAVMVVAVAVGVKMAEVPRPKAAEPPPADEPKKPEAPVPAPEPTPPRPMGPDASLFPTAPTTPPAHKKAATAKPKLLNESELLERLRKAQDTDDFMLSYELAREGQRRFPDSPNAPEIAAMVVKSLARQGKASEARAEAETMVNKYAGTSWAREVERHTGAHPHVNQVPPQ